MTLMVGSRETSPSRSSERMNRSSDATLIVCAVLLAALVYREGWIWPLKAAAVMIPVSLLFS